MGFVISALTATKNNRNLQREKGTLFRQKIVRNSKPILDKKVDAQTKRKQEEKLKAIENQTSKKIYWEVGILLLSTLVFGLALCYFVLQ